jgi:DNA-binding SARP family transcriptional activator
VELYRGALLPGFHFPESRGFQDWLDTTRHAMARDAVKAALAMAEAHAANQERTDVGDLVQFILRLGAVIEDEHQLRKLLHLLDRIGDRPGALRLYEMFRKRLWDDYRAHPADETRTLVERYRR